MGTPHILLLGPAGHGKSTLARGTAGHVQWGEPQSVWHACDSGDLAAIAARRYSAAVLVVAADLGPRPLPGDYLRMARHLDIPLAAVYLSRIDLLDQDPSLLDMVEQDVRLWLAKQGFPADDIPVFRGRGELPGLIATLGQFPGTPTLSEVSVEVLGVGMVTGRGNVVFGRCTEGVPSVGDTLELRQLWQAGCITVGVAEVLSRSDVPAELLPEANCFLRLSGVRRDEIQLRMLLVTPRRLLQACRCEGILRPVAGRLWHPQATVSVFLSQASESFSPVNVNLRFTEIRDWESRPLMPRADLSHKDSHFCGEGFWPIELELRAEQPFLMQPGVALDIRWGQLNGKAFVSRVVPE